MLWTRALRVRVALRCVLWNENISFDVRSGPPSDSSGSSRVETRRAAGGAFSRVTSRRRREEGGRRQTRPRPLERRQNCRE